MSCSGINGQYAHAHCTCHTSPVGARVGTSAVRVGAMAARSSYARVNTTVNNDDHYDDATDEAEGARAVSANQCQVCM